MLFVKLFSALLLVALNGFFVLAEFAIVKVRRTRLEELSKQGVSTAKMALKISHSLDSYLSAIQLGITLASLALGWLGEPAVVSIIKPVISSLPFNITQPLLSTISIAVAFTLITLLHVVLGELIPKSLAIQKAEKMALLVAWPLYIFHKVTFPMVYIFDHVAAFGLKLMGLKAGADHEQSHSEEELRMIVNASYNDGVLNDTEGQLLDNVFTFADKKAHEIMVPRTDMICLYAEDSYEKNMQVILASNYTRFPLCKENKDKVLGLIHLRDMLENEARHTPEKDMVKLAKEVLFVPETMRLSDIMHVMRIKRIHLAVVVDEYGGTAGLISLEDILEEIVGEIQDEYDKELEEVNELPDGSFEISGQLLQGDFEKRFNVDLGDQDDETIGGLVFSLLGRKPQLGDTVEDCGYRFEVTAVDNLRIEKLKVSEQVKTGNSEKDPESAQ